MPVNLDFRDLFAELNAAEARYLLVGAYAVAFHAEPRFTKDLDVWVEPTTPNARRVFDALRRFGAPLRDVSEDDLARPERILQIGIPPNRIDLVTSIDGVDFEKAWQARVETPYGDQKIMVISRHHLIDNKRACGRPQDLLDLKLLERRS